MGEKAIRKTEIKISGLHCAMCVKTVQNSISKIDGVKWVQVNLGTESAAVEYDAEKADISLIEKAITDVGYGVINDKVTLKVGGMSCVMCANTVGKSLKNLDGIIEAEVDPNSAIAVISYNPSLVTISDMKRAIEEVGYEYLGVEGEESTVDLEKEAREKDIRDKKRRFIVGFLFSVPLIIFMYTPINPNFPKSYFMLGVSLLPFLYVSLPIFRAGLKGLRNKTLTMEVMYSMGIGSAYGASLLGTFGVLPKEFMFYETALMLAAFLSLGKYLEAKAKGKTSEAIKKLIGLQPKKATVIRNDTEMEIPMEEVEINDIVLVKPGEKIPVDGEVVEGESFVDEAMISGEPIPIAKKKGDSVVGGTINKNSVLKFVAKRIGKDTVLARIIKLVQEAQSTKPPIQKIADRAVTYFIPIVLTIAILSFIVWFFVLGQPILFAFTTLVSVLVIACPCALGLASPTAITVGVGRGAELGILIKNGEALELSEKLSAVVFDKTGTLTEGKPRVTDIIAVDIDDNELLKLIASVEKNSQHPLAEAIVKKATERDIGILPAEKFDTFSGKGVIGVVDKKEVLIGNKKLFAERGIGLSQSLASQIDNMKHEGKTVSLIAIDGTCKGIVAISDTIKETAKAAIENLKRMNLKVYMITGDNSLTANAVAKQIGIDNVLSEVLPEDKATEVKKLQQNGEVIAFVGDGINDAPALAVSDVGIAMGKGTDIAIESGEIVLIKDNLIDVVAAIQLSKKVIKRIKQNLFWAFAYNSALIPVAAGVLYPIFGITFKPELAGLAMAMSSVTVITLSLMLKKYLPPAKA